MRWHVVVRSPCGGFREPLNTGPPPTPGFTRVMHSVLPAEVNGRLSATSPLWSYKRPLWGGPDAHQTAASCHTLAKRNQDVLLTTFCVQYFLLLRGIFSVRKYSDHNRVRSVHQAVTKCCNVATPLRCTTFFARHKMENVNDKMAFLLCRRDECLFLS